MDIRGGTWRGVVKRQWGNRKRRLSVLSDAEFSESYEIRATLLYAII